MRFYVFYLSLFYLLLFLKFLTTWDLHTWGLHIGKYWKVELHRGRKQR